VVARIVPYNHPLMFTASRLAAPLMAGNAVVVKAPDQAPLSALRLGELLAEHVPPGLVSILSGTGPGAGRAIVEHPDVRRIGFIGSVAVGRDIQRHAAQAAVKAVTLELGGKNAMIVRADAEPSAAADGAIRGMNFRWTAGQSCGSTSRLLVHRSIHDEVVDRIADRVQDIRVGDPLLPETEMGPVISAAHRDRVLAHVDRAVAGGARLVTGGPTAASGAFRRGYWVLPTVLAAVEPGSEVEQREIFGPVLSVLAYDDDATAVRIANGTEYGLTASVWTRDIDAGLRIAQAMDAGYVWINSSSAHVLGTPFGGVKNSGVGREESVEELLSFTQLKTINLALRELPLGGPA
jgi:2-formylbenzoate dehydrogenase